MTTHNLIGRQTKWIDSYAVLELDTPADGTCQLPLTKMIA